jgi:hypothetical protein
VMISGTLPMISPRAVQPSPYLAHLQHGAGRATLLGV